MEFNIDEKQMASIMRRLDRVSPEDKYSIMHNAMQAMMEITHAQLVKNTSGTILKVRTGMLRASMQWRVFSNKSIASIIGIAGSGVLDGKRVKYADIHEVGGVIRPKHGKYLKIPIRNAKRSHSSEITGYRFVKQVTIPARRYMSKSLQQVSRRIMSKLTQKVNQALAKG